MTTPIPLNDQVFKAPPLVARSQKLRVVEPSQLQQQQLHAATTETYTQDAPTTKDIVVELFFEEDSSTKPKTIRTWRWLLAHSIYLTSIHGLFQTSILSVLLHQDHYSCPAPPRHYHFPTNPLKTGLHSINSKTDSGGFIKVPKPDEE